jgi:hypothetical protein
VSTALSNRKKVRGWPRRLRQLDALGRRYAVPGEAALAHGGYDYVRLWLDPWSRLVRRNPPAGMRRRMLAALLDLHRSWEAHLAARGEPFYLAVWLFHPRFHESQLVAAVGERIGYYETSFPPDPGAPPRPPALYDDAAYDLGALAWTPGLDADYVLQSDLDAYPERRAAFERQRHRIADEATTAGGERVYALRAGTVWVGRR